jgi:hypothetical protein
MRGPIDFDRITDALAARVDEIVPELYPAARREGREWLIGDMDGSPGQSLRITRHGAYAGRWKDFNPTGREKGDLLHLVAHVLHGGDLVKAVQWARERLGLGGVALTPQERAKAEALAADRRRAQAQKDAAEKAKKRESAKTLFFGGEPFAGSPAEAYLAGRAIDLNRLPRRPAALKFSPAVWCKEAGRDLPAMLACVTDAAAGAVMGTHRTWIERAGEGWVKARLEDAKKSLGDVKGGLIPLNRGHSGVGLKDGPAGEWLAIGEGIETCLSYAIANPAVRVASCVALGFLGSVRLPEHVGGIYVLADNDPTTAVLDRELAKLTERGLPFVAVRPPEGHKDFNDWLKALAGAAGEGRAA